MSSERCRRVVEALARRGQWPTASAWFTDVLEAIGPSGPLEDDTLTQLASQARGDYGLALRHFEDDGAAHVSFWRELHRRFPECARVTALFADQLFQFGADAERADAFELFLAAARADPQQFMVGAGELYDFALNRGGQAWRDYRLARIRFYMDEVNRGEMDPKDLGDEVQDFLHELDDQPDVRADVVKTLRAMALHR